MIANPDRPLRDCAEYLGYTKEWVYRLVNTDMFREAFKRRAEEVGLVVANGLKDKLCGLAELVVDEVTDRIVNGEVSERFLVDTMRTTLGALGYSSGQAQAQSQSLHVHIDPNALIEARERAMALREGRTEVKGVQIA